jgi:DNA-binding ferritin-like protein (Dps family)
MSLNQALQTVAGEDVCEFAEKLLTDKRLSEQHNNNNL